MDVTPSELRETEIKDSMRGYNHDEVDDLLERAAATIDAYEQRVRALEDQVATGGSAALAPAPAENPEDVLNVLSLAKKTADEAVREANSRAEKILSEAEEKVRVAEERAQELTDEAEETARAASEEARRRAEDEVRDLAHRRDMLQSDIDALERFEQEYRARLREALEAELDMFTNRPMGGKNPRPELHDVEIPSEESRVAVSMEAAGISAGGGESDEGTVDFLANFSVRRDDKYDLPEASEEPQAPQENMDDEAFFASLREAVDPDAEEEIQEDDDKP